MAIGKQVLQRFIKQYVDLISITNHHKADDDVKYWEYMVQHVATAKLSLLLVSHSLHEFFLNM
jgi:hypothetical protein